MTLKEIKAMFQVGQVWNVTRAGGKPLVVHGNLGSTTLPANNSQEIRTVKKVGSIDLVWSRESGRDVYTKYPKADEVIEARPGFLKFAYDNGITVTLEKI